MDEAAAMGAIALFGEKYGDRVRVVKFGPSVELCGGCHAWATGNIGLFKIVSESAIAAGIRRIEAVTGEEAEKYVFGLQELVRSARALFNNVPDLAGAIRHLIEDNATYKKQAEEFARQKAAEFAKFLAARAKDVNGVKLISVTGADLTPDVDPTFMRNAAQTLQKELMNTVLVVAFSYEGKPQLLLMYSNDLVAKGKNAGKDIREAAKFILGGGGGQPSLASACGKDASGLEKAMEALVAIATS